MNFWTYTGTKHSRVTGWNRSPSSRDTSKFRNSYFGTRFFEFDLRHFIYKQKRPEISLGAFFNLNLSRNYTRLKMSDVLIPPKAKLLDMMYSTSISRPEPVM